MKWSRGITIMFTKFLLKARAKLYPCSSWYHRGTILCWSAKHLSTILFSLSPLCSTYCWIEKDKERWQMFFWAWCSCHWSSQECCSYSHLEQNVYHKKVWPLWRHFPKLYPEYSLLMKCYLILRNKIVILHLYLPIYTDAFGLLFTDGVLLFVCCLEVFLFYLIFVLKEVLS